MEPPRPVDVILAELDVALRLEPEKLDRAFAIVNSHLKAQMNDSFAKSANGLPSRFRVPPS